MIDLDSCVLYEDENILAINKPSGLVVHSDGRTQEPTVAEWMLERYPESRNVGEPIIKSDGIKIERPGIVHRIDRETSGVLLLAKTEKGFDVLKSQFQNRQVDKVYRLFVHGLIKDDLGTINLPIGRSASDFRKWSAERGMRGEKREAVTYFKVLARDSDKGVTFVEAKPKTGRTHQIRVHFKALHHPVIGDSLYAPKVSRILGFSRLALHAFSVSFKNTDEKEVKVEAPYPEDFNKALQELRISA